MSCLDLDLFLPGGFCLEDSVDLPKVTNIPAQKASLAVYDAAMEGGGYICPAPGGSYQQEDAQATTSTNPFAWMNPFNSVLQEPSGTGTPKEHALDESATIPPFPGSTQQPSPDAEVPSPSRIPLSAPTNSNK